LPKLFKGCYYFLLSIIKVFYGEIKIQASVKSKITNILFDIHRWLVPQKIEVIASSGTRQWEKDKFLG
jgi:hypothetical protein